MCGRFTFTVELSELAQAFPWLTVPDADLVPRYNIAPTQPVPVVANRDNKTLEFFNWGLIPSWAKDTKIGSRLINARAETLADKPSFRAAYRRRRCLVFADGFYEWRKDATSEGDHKAHKVQVLIRLKTGEPFGFAGLWETWYSPEGDLVLSCAIITTTPNRLVQPIHTRMPVILQPEAYEKWLDPAEKKPDGLQPFLRPYPAEEMEAFTVSTLVNNPANDVPECVLPV